MANDVVFVLRFDTKAGEAQVRALANTVQATLSQALNISPRSDISSILGLKTALNEINLFSNELKDLERQTNRLGLKSKQLSDIRNAMAGQFDPNRGRFVDPATGKLLKDPSKREDIQALDQIIASTKRKESKLLTDRLRAIKPMLESERAALDAKINNAKQVVLKGILEQAQKQRQQASVEARINAARIALERKALQGIASATEQKTLFKLQNRNAASLRQLMQKGGFEEILPMAQAKQASDKQRRIEAGKLFGQGRKEGVILEGETLNDFIDDPSKLQDRIDRRQALKTKGGKSSLTPAEMVEQANLDKGTFLKQKTDAFKNQGKGKANPIAKLFGARDMDFKEFLGHERTKGKRIGPEQALGISPTATRLLALSSILAPLNTQLGAVAMQAGFAAFSLGAPVAALSLLSSAIAGFTSLLKKSVTAAKEAGMETTKWSSATTRLNLEIRQFLNVIGLKTQLAFAPVADDLTELFDTIEELPWNEIINGAAAASEGLLGLVKYLTWVQEKSLAFQLLKGKDFLEDFARLKGEQKIDLGKLYGSGQVGGLGITGLLSSLMGGPGTYRTLFDEIKGIFGPEMQKQLQFVSTPSFSMSNVEDVGRDIQKSIFKEAGMSPEEKAIKFGNDILKSIALSSEMTTENTKKLVDKVTGQVPTLR